MYHMWCHVVKESYKNCSDISGMSLNLCSSQKSFVKLVEGLLRKYPRNAIFFINKFLSVCMSQRINWRISIFFLLLFYDHYMPAIWSRYVEVIIWLVDMCQKVHGAVEQVIPQFLMDCSEIWYVCMINKKCIIFYVHVFCMAWVLNI